MFKLTSLGLLTSLLLAGSMWFYVECILVPHQKRYAAEHGIPRGNLSDLYPRWLGSRALLLNGRDPYSPEVTQEIQTGYYGRPLDPARSSDPRDEERFAYPVYVAFLLAPTLTLPFSIVQSIFAVALAALTALTVPLWLYILGWRCSPAATATLIVLTMGSFGAVQGIKLQQLTLLVAALIAAAVAALVSGRLLFAGLLVALSTIKPQLALPLTTWLVLWSLGNLRSRSRFLASFVLSMAGLTAASQYVLPGWLGRFLNAMAEYRRYTGGAGSVLDVLLSPTVGSVLAFFLVIFIVAMGWRNRHASADSDCFRATTALVLAINVVIVPMTAPYNQLLLLPAILLIIRSVPRLWSSSSLARAILIMASAIVLEPFLAAFVLTVMSPITPLKTLLGLWSVPLYTSLAIPIAVFALLLISLRLDRFLVAGAWPAGHSA